MVTDTGLIASDDDDSTITSKILKHVPTRTKRFPHGLKVVAEQVFKPADWEGMTHYQRSKVGKLLSCLVSSGRVPELLLIEAENARNGNRRYQVRHHQ